MEKILLVKELYVEAFRDWRNWLLKDYFKVFSWFCFALILMASYALVFRIATGYAFD